MSELLRETLLYIEEQHQWLTHIRSIIDEKEKKYELIHLKITKELNECDGNEQSQDNMEIKNKITTQNLNKHIESSDAIEIVDYEDVIVDERENIETNKVNYSENEPNYSGSSSYNSSTETEQDVNGIFNTSENNYEPVFEIQEDGGRRKPDKDIKNTRVDNSSEDNTDTLNSDNFTINENILHPKSDDRMEETLNDTDSNAVENQTSENLEAEVVEQSTVKDKFLNQTRGTIGPVNCPYCNKLFTRKSNLHKHLRIHLGEKPFECSFCGKRFTEKGSLKSHIRIHTGEKPYSCQYCGKSFSASSTRTKHVRIHTGEKPFRCRYCDKTFSRRYTLTKHLELIHNELNTK